MIILIFSEMPKIILDVHLGMIWELGVNSTILSRSNVGKDCKVPLFLGVKLIEIQQ